MKYLKEWEQVYEDPELQANLIRNKNALKTIFEETRWILMKENKQQSRFQLDFQDQNHLKEYTFAYLGEKSLFLVRACNLIFDSAQATTTIWGDCHTKNTHVPNA